MPRVTDKSSGTIGRSFSRKNPKIVSNLACAPSDGENKENEFDVPRSSQISKAKGKKGDATEVKLNGSTSARGHTSSPTNYRFVFRTTMGRQCRVHPYVVRGKYSPDKDSGPIEDYTDDFIDPPDYFPAAIVQKEDECAEEEDDDLPTDVDSSPIRTPKQSDSALVSTAEPEYSINVRAGPPVTPPRPSKRVRHFLTNDCITAGMPSLSDLQAMKELIEDPLADATEAFTSQLA